MNHRLLSSDVVTALGIEALSEHDQIAFLSDYGDTILVAALNELEPLLPSPEQEKLHEYLATDPEPEELFAYLITEYEAFARILKAAAEEVRA